MHAIVSSEIQKSDNKNLLPFTSYKKTTWVNKASSVKKELWTHETSHIAQKL